MYFEIHKEVVSQALASPAADGCNMGMSIYFWVRELPGK